MRSHELWMVAWGLGLGWWFGVWLGVWDLGALGVWLSCQVMGPGALDFEWGVLELGVWVLGL